MTAQERFEYTMAVWAPSDDGSATLGHLNRMGAEAWSVVAASPRAAVVPMPGMGGQAVPELVLILQRSMSS